MSRVSAIMGLAVAAALRLAILFRYRIDSDETQHLHVVWGWSHGLLPYRDFFDNHMPLFHILAVPLLRLAGERPEALLLGRLLMVPLLALIALLSYRIGIRCYEKRAVIVAVTIGCLIPDFFLCSVEFRPDVLWAVFWLATLAILIGGPLTPWRAAAAGITLGLAASVSAKTSLLAAVLAIAALVTFGGVSKRALIVAGAALVPPALIGLYFAARDAWAPFFECTIGHNLVASEHPQRLLAIPLSVFLMVRAARRIVRDEQIPSDVRRRRLFLLLATWGYAVALVSAWPIIEREHWLPFYPVAVVAVIGLLPESRRVVISAVAIELLGIVFVSTPWRDQVTPTSALIQQTVALTAPGESVLDLKGEMLFRRRAFYYVLEKITKRAISSGRLQDTIAADVLRTHTMVAVPDNPGFPKRGRAFLLRNFVDVGSVRVAGVIVPSETFRIEIPAEYSVVTTRGEFRGLLDGTRYTGARFLGAGVHRISGPGPLAVVWARAAALGFSPFSGERPSRPQPPGVSPGDRSVIGRDARSPRVGRPLSSQIAATVHDVRDSRRRDKDRGESNEIPERQRLPAEGRKRIEVVEGRQPIESAHRLP